ncbi:TonB-dependent receptor plug domain-containing protein [Acetobacter orleanensis]|uniref:TonB-dependent receptor n=1 Tax=Acetobacter orleanensis TaxID=104099 RepID=A0A4Y3TNE6_9PROT|nr:TonB-dependent receptor plug domain-containing protein [Acetobacter orleanensis]KXV63067.1 hypothetical protein AD949_08360 [Acetobacter orleanensis]PCD78853.1 hypothetical protein CO710_10140 [Acetobacter orleanensis]GAN68813.1 hypothetical protein Abol_022_027 [Acetobacter orleanensis JCM 7639]GBR24357.1 hypothetical protein AA0473_0614 [Acetobacter orleanensis NRIC 0473]GEB83304.1 TonB-dependent receptor [Acetobacter orleanensis]
MHRVVRATLAGGLGLAGATPSVLAQQTENPSVNTDAHSQTTTAPAQPGLAANASPEKIDVVGHKARGQALGHLKPLMQIKADEIRAYGVDSASDLLTAIAPETRSGRGAGGNAPVTLLNGKRVSGMQELQDLPFETIERVEIFTEEEALKYGYSASQRVVNIITVERFRAIRARLMGTTSTDGGGETGAPAISYTKLEGERRINLSARYSTQADLKDSQRGVVPARASGLYANAGNVTAINSGSLDPRLDALAGVPVPVAGAPSLSNAQVPTFQDFLPYATLPHSDGDASAYTLQPSLQKLAFNGVVAGQIFKTISSSLNLAYTRKDQRSLQGPARGVLTLPASSLFSPFSDNILLYRNFTNISPLRQKAHTETAHAGLKFDGNIGDWKWNSTGSYDWSETTTSSQTGLNLQTAQTDLMTEGNTLNPFSLFPARILSQRTLNYGHTTSNNGQISGLITGALFALPAGDVATSSSLTGALTDQNTFSAIKTTRSSSHIQRDVGIFQFNADIPLANRSKHILSFLGKLDGNINAAVNQVSHFGTLGTIGGGVTWSPLSWMQFPISLTNSQEAPTASQLVAPTIQTPNVTTYDYVTGQSVQVTSLSGGNPFLKATSRHEISLGTILTLPYLTGTLLHVNYVHDTTHNTILTLPTATAAIENAFPDRYLRNAAGLLESVDTRPLNADGENRSEWNATLSFSRPLHAGGTDKHGKPEKPHGRLYLVATQVWRLRDTVTLRAGLPAINLLKGGTISGLGGQPRHEMELQGGVYDKGLGLRLVGKWQAGTATVASSAADNLSFSALGTMDATVFADLGQLPHWERRTWAKNFRLFLSVENLFNERIHVHNGKGSTPAGYQPAFMDPLGRTITLSLRKTV